MAVSLKGLKTLKLKNLKKRGKQNLFVVPFLFTFANAVFGLLSVIKTLEADFVAAAYCIILAAVMDFFDGKLARAFKTTSCLGMELDSLCDAISFCFAPAILLYSWYFCNFGIFGTFLVCLYLCFGLLRLAKFNIISLNKEQNLSYFIGLPTTLAAFFISTLIIRFEIISNKIFPFLQNPIYMFLLIFCISGLMISSVKFLSLKKLNYKLLLFAGSIGIIIYVPCFLAGLPLLFIGILSYTLSSVIYYVFSNSLRFLNKFF
ncbi:MAG: CDP-diacylglycerol-serine O-phosphatidyltransferase [candidate division TM6 bacterium GW2011_GWF2_30_66]|nr:MAG: CDP-diacylglycerol-serine O-phosphatidyltransferase [candidate division TM6 bacterium GW2011_GWF2_30_66]